MGSRNLLKAVSLRNLFWRDQPGNLFWSSSLRNLFGATGSDWPLPGCLTRPLPGCLIARSETCFWTRFRPLWITQTPDSWDSLMSLRFPAGNQPSRLHMWHTARPATSQPDRARQRRHHRKFRELFRIVNGSQRTSVYKIRSCLIQIFFSRPLRGLDIMSCSVVVLRVRATPVFDRNFRLGRCAAST